MIIADTGFWLALGNQGDAHHGAAKEALRSLAEPLTTTWPVLTEAAHLLTARVGPDSTRRLLQAAVDGVFLVFPLTASHLPRMVELMDQYRDLPMDLADASLVVLAEHLGSGRILSTDQRDFGAYRWKSRHPFENLLLPAAPPPRRRPRTSRG